MSDAKYVCRPAAMPEQEPAVLEVKLELRTSIYIYIYIHIIFSQARICIRYITDNEINPASDHTCCARAR